jgi:hypothetical protein
LYQWEREALGIETLGELAGGAQVQGRLEEPPEGSTAWWISALFAPDIWKIWRVGLLRLPLSLRLQEPLRQPDPVEFRLSATVPSAIRHQLAHLEAVSVSPAVVAGQALGFLVRTAAEEAAAERATGAAHLVRVFAPTGLRSRLGLDVGRDLRLHVLPADEYRP